MPRYRLTRWATSKAKLMPFSMILQPEELSALRHIADKNGVSVAAIIRSAIDTIIFREYPERKKRIVEEEAEAFLERMSQRLPPSILTSAKRKEFKRQAVAHLA